MDSFMQQILGVDLSTFQEFTNLPQEQTLNVLHNLLIDADPELTETVLRQATEAAATEAAAAAAAAAPPPFTPTMAGVKLEEMLDAASDTKSVLARPVATHTLPMSAFYPLGKADTTPTATTEGYQVVILKQPPPEVTKAVYVELQVQLLGPDHSLVTDFHPVATLLYEDGQAVKPQSGHDVLEGMQTIRDNVCILKVRINELSKAHRNQRFKVKVVASGPFGRAAVFTTPMRVLSKTSIILQHKAALAPAAATTDAGTPAAASLDDKQRVTGKRGRDDTSSEDGDDPSGKRVAVDASEVAALRVLCMENRVQQDVYQQRTQQQLTELRTAVQTLTEKMEEIKQLLLGRMLS